jgi:TIGR03009 family protein
MAQLLGKPTRQLGGPTGQPGPPASQSVAVGAPFQLSPVELQFVDQVLMMWENESNKITTYDCDFERWEYDPVFGPGENIPLIKSQGQLTYAKPDKGSFKINSIQRWVRKDPQQTGQHILQKNEVGEHWVCDGKAIFEYKHEKKQLVVQPLPLELRGKSIVDGPLPFLFGADAKRMKARYWIRSPQGNAATITLQAYPRRQVDAANYHHVEVMLDRKTMLPKAIQVHMPNNRNRAVYIFSKPTINGKMNQLFGAFFQSPRTPLGWTRVVQPQPDTNPQAVLPQEEARK